MFAPACAARAGRSSAKGQAALRQVREAIAIPSLACKVRHPRPAGIAGGGQGARSQMNPPQLVLPKQTRPYYGGDWHDPLQPRSSDNFSPATGELLATVAEAGADDVPAAVAAAQAGFEAWRDVAPLERARILRALASVVRAHGEELALLDAIDCGNPFSELKKDVEITAGNIEYFAGLVTEMKGASVPMGPDALSFSVREPYGVVARICPFNHPMMFGIGKIGAPLAAGNSIIVKPPEQAPLSVLRAAELFHGLLPPGVLNVLPGDREMA